jgi:diadenylate cyclase
MESLLNYLDLDFRGIVEILIMAALFYFILNYMRGTRGEGIWRGIIYFLIVAFLSLLLTSEYLTRIDFLLKRFLTVAVIGIIVIFQPELRRGLIRLGQNPLFGRFLRGEAKTIHEIVQAAETMSKKRIGGLVTIVREIGLGTYIEGGVSIDSDLSAELLTSIFWPGNPLHDGAVIIQHARVMAAACFFPLTESPALSKSMGTRHRAAIGITEETDAIAIVVSEETGAISVAVRGQITTGLDAASLRKTLQNLLLRPAGKGAAAPVDITEEGSAFEEKEQE